MRKKLILAFSVFALLICFIASSCKKSSQDYIPTLLTNGQWQLASVIVLHYIGSQYTTDTLNTACNLVQTFKFNTDKTCTYTNFDCNKQTASGHWSLSKDELFLATDIKMTDTVASDNSLPFKNAQIINLGQYSFIIKTGDLETFYSPTSVRTVYQYGFIRVKTQ
ncbi:MAG: hypothetical protein ACHQHN_03910 [Sphingobacteriales bacterium]